MDSLSEELGQIVVESAISSLLITVLENARD